VEVEQKIEPGFWRQLGVVLKGIFITGPLLLLLILRFVISYFTGGHGREVTKNKQGGKERG